MLADGAPLWAPRIPPGLWMTPEMRDATGWCMGKEPAELW